MTQHAPPVNISCSLQVLLVRSTSGQRFIVCAAQIICNDLPDSLISHLGYVHIMSFPKDSSVLSFIEFLKINLHW